MNRVVVGKLFDVASGLFRFVIAILCLGASYYGFVHTRYVLMIVGALTFALSMAPLKPLKAPFGESIRLPAVLILFLISMYLAS